MLKENIRLADYSNYKIGGPARYFEEAKSIEEVKSVLKEWRGPLFILGGGTNILFPDEGFDGLVLRPIVSTLERRGNLVQVGAGVAIDDFLSFLVQNQLAGFEWAGGLPGLIGGAIRGNAGAFGGETKDSVISVKSLDISGPEPVIRERHNAECEFGYRTSVFKKRDAIGSGRKEIIIESIFSFSRGESDLIQRSISEKITYREERQPLEYPNIGSIFKNVDASTVAPALREQVKAVIKTDPFPVIPTAHLLSEAGLKGERFGQAMISPKHPNFIVNLGGATATDVKQLINRAKEKVKNQFEVQLEEEVIIL
jgi:UDP-N-acetylmuramate dehydrogenase